MVAIIPRLPKRVAWNCPDDQEFQNRATETEVEVATFWASGAVGGLFHASWPEAFGP